MSTYLYGGCDCTYSFQTESTFYSCMNVKKLFAWNMHEIWSLSDCNGSRTHNHFVCKRPLYHLAKLTKLLSYVVSTSRYAAFDCMLLSFRRRVPEWIHTLQFPECQETPCWKQAWNLKFKWLQWDSNPQSLISPKNNQPFSQIGQMIELSCEY